MSRNPRPVKAGAYGTARRISGGVKRISSIPNNCWRNSTARNARSGSPNWQKKRRVSETDNKTMPFRAWLSLPGVKTPVYPEKVAPRLRVLQCRRHFLRVDWHFNAGCLSPSSRAIHGMVRDLYCLMTKRLLPLFSAIASAVRRTRRAAKPSRIAFGSSHRCAR